MTSHYWINYNSPEKTRIGHKAQVKSIEISWLNSESGKPAQKPIKTCKENVTIRLP
jgi:hypothetical protein